MFTVYILKSINHKWVYIDMTTNFENRFKRHQAGAVTSTKYYQPFSIINTETFNTSFDARNREKWLKSRSGKRWVYKKFNIQ